VTKNELATIVDRHPAVIKAYTGFTQAGVKPLLKPAERLAAIEKLIPLVCNRINLECDWDFNTDEVEMQTVANQGVYKCVGNDDDARDIITVSYGADEDSLVQLDEFNSVEGNDLQYAGISGVAFWQHSTRKSDFPHFELVGAPTSAGYLLKVSYRMKTMEIVEFPEGFELMLQWGLMAEIVPSFEAKYREMLNLLAARHQGSGREYSRVRGDPDIEARNVQFNTLRGPY